MPIEFDTARLRLRQWVDSDHAPFAALNADPRVMVFLPAPLDHAASDAMAARGALQIGLERLGLPEIGSFAALGNRRSRAVMARLGMREADETFEHPHVPVGSPLRRHCLYRLTRDISLRQE